MLKISQIDRAKELLERIPNSVCLEGVDRVQSLIESTCDEEQQRDHVSSIFLATLLANCTTKLVFEEQCKNHISKGPHDLVAYLNDGTRVVNEVRRLKQTAFDRKEEEAYTYGLVAKLGRLHGELYQLLEDPSRTTTNFADTILKEIKAKQRQLDRDYTNIVWLTSKGGHYEADNIEDVAQYFIKPPANNEQNQDYSKPENLSAVGWFWDGDPEKTSVKPHCFFLTESTAASIFERVMVVRRVLTK